MHRFFVPPEWIDGGRVALGGSLVHQIRHVLRLRPGDHVVVLDNSGWEWEVELTSVGPESVEGRVVHKGLATGEPRTKITLYQGALKGRNFELVLQKGTELGVVEFVPVISDRCVIASLDDVNKKRERWQRIILEAAEQSRRGRLPHLRPAMLFALACERAQRTEGLSLMPWEEASQHSLRRVLTSRRPFSVNVFIGPEGGFSPQEVALAQGYGIVPITLGPRILRAETAGLAVVAAILYELGDWE